MIYVNLDNVTLASNYYIRLLAHEWQHALHWRVDPNEELWLNEGLSEVVATLATGVTSGLDQAYQQRADLPLLAWNQDEASLSAYYGGADLFLRYILDRFGDSFLRRVVVQPNDGGDAFSTVLGEMRLDFAHIYVDWLTSNGMAGKIAHSGLHTSFPAQGNGAVYPFGVDVIEVYSNSERTLRFQG